MAHRRLAAVSRGKMERVPSAHGSIDLGPSPRSGRAQPGDGEGKLDPPHLFDPLRGELEQSGNRLPNLRTVARIGARHAGVEQLKQREDCGLEPSHRRLALRAPESRGKLTREY